MSIEASTAATAPDAIVQVNDLRKTFGKVVAIDRISMSVARGTITALVGDNGAGKSTLIKCIAGFHHPDEGTITFEGKPITFSSPAHARELGIETVYQDLALVDDLTVWQNLFLDREHTRGWGPFQFLDRKAMIRESEEKLKQLAIHIPSVRSRVRRLSGGQRQAVALARAAGWGSRLVIMDEPTAALGVRETAHVEELILGLAERGISVLLISHNFDQVMRLAEFVVVMRGGHLVGRRVIAETTGAELVAMITAAEGMGGGEEAGETTA